MIRNFLKTAWRTLVHNRTYSLTNMIGLTLGLTVVMLIATRVLDELSYDQHWNNKEELYRIRTSYETHGGNRNQSNTAPGGLAQAWTADYPEINGHTTIETGDLLIMLDSLTGNLAELSILRVDTGFFHLFDTRNIVGNPKHLLAHAHNLAITESAHQRYFGGQPVEGKIFYNIPLEGEPEPYVIHAILQDLPQNSYLHADAIVVAPRSAAYEPGKNQGFGEQYLLLSPGTDTASLNAKFNVWYQQRETEERNLSNHFTLQSVKDVYLRSAPVWDSPMRDVYLFSGIGLLILVLVSINFINLTFAHAVKRTMESGVRKVLGAERRHFFYQLGTESLLLFGGSLLLAFVLYLLAFHPFETYLEHPLTLSFHHSPLLLSGLFILWLALGLLCSLFPALALSKTKAAQGLKKKLSVLSLPMNTGFTRGLVAIQFGIAILVVICMLTIRAQLEYLDTKDLGYDPENLLLIEHADWGEKGTTFKQTLLQQPGIQSVSLSQWTPFQGSVSFLQMEDPEKPDNGDSYILISVDFDFVETIGLDILSGRNLNPAFAMDAMTYTPETIANKQFSNVLITESIANKYNMEADQFTPLLSRTPVGVIQDLHAASLRYPIAPIIVEAQEGGEHLYNMLIRTVDGQEQVALAALSATWKQFFPGRILPRTHRVADQVRAQYDSERKQYQQLAFFGAVSMLIALLGVLGLAIYTIERRIKEIGIRKILGASVRSIVTLMSRSFATPVLIAVLLAFPAAWWFMHRWLENFAYHIAIPISLFVLTGALAFAGMLCIVGWQAIRAAVANPVDSLRDE